MRACFGKQAFWSTRDWNYVFFKRSIYWIMTHFPFLGSLHPRLSDLKHFLLRWKTAHPLKIPLTTYTKTLTALSHLLRHNPASPLSLTARNMLEKASLILIQSRSPVCPCGPLGWRPHNSETLSTYSNRHSGCSQYQLKDNTWIELETHKDLCLI